MKARYIIGLVVLVFAVTIAISSAVSSSQSPLIWARRAPLERVTIGGARPQWDQLTDRISDKDRQGVPKDQLLDIIVQRPDNPDRDLMPIPYLQWIHEDHRHLLLKLLAP